MADGGIDAISHGDVVYQVKWTSKFEQNPASWLKSVIDGERDNIARLKEEKGISRYVLMTSVAGTTTAYGTGSVQKLQNDLDEYSRELGIPIECWWQADIDAEVDDAPDSIKWAYQEMLAGSEAIRYLIYGSQDDGQAHQMRKTILKVMSSQWTVDSKIKFSQVDMDRVDITQLFIEAKVKQLDRPQSVEGHANAGPETTSAGVGAVKYMLKPSYPLTYLLGVPGQGKSTLGQYLCQIHRGTILPELSKSTRDLPETADPKLPLRLDLSEYAQWISGMDPFGEDGLNGKARLRRRDQQSLELFLVAFCTFHSGGRKVTVEQIHSLLDRYPVFLVLDGLDEVADTRLRTLVVEQINSFCRRVGAAEQKRSFHVLVTSRPNASSLPEPDKEIFQTLELRPLDAELQRQFVDRWAELNAVSGPEKAKLRRTFEERTVFDHVAQLADNPMQLTILLFLISRKGDAVPISRTPLYTDYMTTLLDREVASQQIHRDHVEKVEEVTSFLGWHMQSGVESVRGAARMPLSDIEDTLFLYFRKTGGPSDLVEELFKAVTLRFWALTSKSEGTFEFAVQPVREYFAARFLAEWGGPDGREPLSKLDVLKQLVGRNYWLNTARFYAGFANPNELAGLRYGLEEALAEAAHPLQERVAVWTLLSDGIFSNKAVVQRDVAELLTDDLTIRLATIMNATSGNFPRLSGSSGGDSLKAGLLRDIDSNPQEAIALARVAMLHQHGLIGAKDFQSWWNPRMQNSIGTPLESAWLSIGAVFGVPKLLPPHADRLSLSDSEACRAALRANASPSPGTTQDERLLQAVLDGLCSEEETTSSSHGGNLLRSMRPYWFIRIAESGSTGPAVSTNHFWSDDPEKYSRSEAFRALIMHDSRYERIQQSARSNARGQKGTTEPWQNAARELAEVHGPCWLAADIAVIGAATQDTRPEGSFSKGGEPFGPSTDYGTLVLNLRKRPSSDWWQDHFDKYQDSLSRRTWAFALLATADQALVLDHIGNLDAVSVGLSDRDFYALATSSGRLGATSIPRRLSQAVLSAATAYSDRTLLLISHFVSDLKSFDELDSVNDEQLARLADSSTYNWSVARAVSARLLSHSNADLLEGLARLGQECVVEVPKMTEEPGADIISGILHQPATYPASWVRAAERWHSMSVRESPLGEHAAAEQWVPSVPRL